MNQKRKCVRLFKGVITEKYYELTYLQAYATCTIQALVCCYEKSSFVHER